MPPILAAFDGTLTRPDATREEVYQCINTIAADYLGTDKAVIHHSMHSII